MKRIVIILDGLFVYWILMILLLVFTQGNSVVDWLWENAFGNSVFTPVGWILLYELTMFLVTSVLTVKSFGKAYCVDKKTALSLAKVQMIVRLLQIPAYAAIFIAGVIGVLTIFTIGISLVLAVFDVFSIITTGIASLAVYRGMYKAGLINSKEQGLYSVLSFIYCLDVIVAVVSYQKGRNCVKYE